MKMFLNYYRIILISFSICFFKTSILAEEVYKNLDELIAVVEDERSKYSFYVPEDFEGNIPWKIIRSVNSLNQVNLIRKFPRNESFAKECEYYKKWKKDMISCEKSIQIHSSFEIPSREKILISPYREIYLPSGTPSQIFIWVHSSNYNFKLKALISFKNREALEADFGNLDFYGWKRLQAKITFQKDTRLNYSKNENFSLHGLLIEPNFGAPKGSFQIYLDQIGILIIKPPEYPGSEIPDGWTRP